MPTISPTLLSTKPSNPAPTPDKVVTLTCTNGVWSVDVKILNPDKPFTERDYNQIERTFTAKRVELRRLAALAYHAELKKKPRQV